MKIRCIISLILLMLVTSSYAATTVENNIANLNQSATQETILGPNGLGQLKLGMKWKKDNIVDQLVKFSDNPAMAGGCVDGNLITSWSNSTCSRRSRFL